MKEKENVKHIAIDDLTIGATHTPIESGWTVPLILENRALYSY
jgi:hypothetical protein